MQAMARRVGNWREKALTPTSLTHSVLVTVGHSVAY